MSTLTLAGKTSTIDDTYRVASFRKLVTLMLALARQDAKLTDLAARQNAWLDRNHDHPLFFQRYDEHRSTLRRLTNLHTDLHMAKCHASNAIIDLQPATLDALAVTYGSLVTVASPEAWMLAALNSPDASDDDVLAGKVAPF